MDKNRRQYAHFKKGANIVAPKNSLFSEIMRVDFEFFFDYAGREQQNQIALWSQNLRDISGIQTRF